MSRANTVTAPKPAGRPPLPEAERRSIVLSLRIKPDSAKQLDTIPMSRADAARTIFALGLAAWAKGHRTPDTIRKRAK